MPTPHLDWLYAAPTPHHDWPKDFRVHKYYYLRALLHTLGVSSRVIFLARNGARLGDCSERHFVPFNLIPPVHAVVTVAIIKVMC